MKRVFIFVFVLIFSAPVQAAKVGLYAGAAPLLQFPGTLRIGIDEWEFGLLNSYSVGFNKNIKVDSSYSSFGIAAIFHGDVSAGFFAAVGWEPMLFWDLHFRVELNSAISYTGFGRGEGYMGLSYYF